MLSIIIPVLNEGSTIEAGLSPLQALRRLGAEVIVVDGGSEDGSSLLAAALSDRMITATRGRATQMNAGARQSRGEHLLFLHADTRLPENALVAIESCLAKPDCEWGRFDVEIVSHARSLAAVAFLMNVRSRWTGIATGDQAIFVRRTAFERVGGFPEIALMEDIALSRSLKRLSRPACIRTKVRTSSRRWEEHGVVATILLMWKLRLAYFLGADPSKLADRYRHARQ